jgi:hypothetical protein
MSNITNPAWWTSEIDATWQRVKAAAQRDWEQTKHHFGSSNPDTGQGAVDTIKQAAGGVPMPAPGASARVFDDVEPAYRLGYSARHRFGKEFSEWNDALEARLQAEWENESPAPANNWASQRNDVRRGWDYVEKEPKSL